MSSDDDASPPPWVTRTGGYRVTPLDGSTISVSARDLFSDTAAGLSADPREHVLVVIHGAGQGATLLVGASAISIGRAPPADLILPDARVSRMHCEVRLAGDHVEVIDRGSTNGTYVGSIRVNGSALLPRDEVLRVGDHLLRHRYWTRHELEEWQRLNLPEPVHEVRIDIDEQRRREDVERITRSPFFDDIVTEIDRLRIHDEG